MPGMSRQMLPGPHRPLCRRLFVTTGRTKNTVSFWLRRVISLAYQLSGKPLPTASPLARETRGIAPSLLFKKNYAVSQVLKAGTSCPFHLAFLCCTLARHPMSLGKYPTTTLFPLQPCLDIGNSWK